MTYSEASKYLLLRLPMFQQVGGAAFKPGLQRIQALCEALGNPQAQVPCVHVAGTNGKGSSSHLIASILQEAGYSVGLTTSPHLQSFTERIRCEGQEIAKKSVTYFVRHNQQRIEELQASFFEAVMAMAFWYFAKKKVHISVIETGLGGRLDASNIVLPVVSLITNIGYDHEQFLGDTLPKIATEKAGIIKKNTPVVIGEQHPDTQNVFLKKAMEERANIYFAQDKYHLLSSSSNDNFLDLCIQSPSETYTLSSALMGNYQKKNVLGVLQTIEILQEKGYHINRHHIQQGFRNVVSNTGLRGRWQLLSHKPLMIADTAHNIQGINEVVEQIRQTPYRQLHLVLGFMRDKDVDKLLTLYPKDAFFYFCKPPLERAMDTHVLAGKAEKLQLQFQCFEEVDKAIRAAFRQCNRNEDLIFIGGSTFVVAQIKRNHEKI